MNDFFPEDIKDASDKIGNDFIKAIEFEGDGLVLQVVQPLEKVKSNNPKYGALETDWLVQKELLEEGETFRFLFKTVDGQERKFDSKSAPFFLGFKQVEELGVGDWISIVRTGKTDKTRYTVTKVDAPNVIESQRDKTTKAKGYEYPEEKINPEDVPF